MVNGTCWTFLPPLGGVRWLHESQPTMIVYPELGFRMVASLAITGFVLHSLELYYSYMQAFLWPGDETISSPGSNVFTNHSEWPIVYLKFRFSHLAGRYRPGGLPLSSPDSFAFWCGDGTVSSPGVARLLIHERLPMADDVDVDSCLRGIIYTW